MINSDTCHYAALLGHTLLERSRVLAHLADGFDGAYIVFVTVAPKVLRRPEELKLVTD